MMANFLDIALPLAERGFRVFPLIPKDKRPFAMSGESDHFDAATTDAKQIASWAAQKPDANVGLCPDEIFCFLETDDEAALKAGCADIPPEVWDTTRVSARENRCYYIFRQTMRTKRAGNMTAARKDADGNPIENLFEFKQNRLIMTGPGSIHPKTGKPYVAEWRSIPGMPDVLLNRLCELCGTPKAVTSGGMTADVKRETDLLDRFLACYEVAVTGDWFNKGKQWYRPIECPWRDTHENTNEGTSTCIMYIEGGGYGFDCKHRCAGKGWKEFRAEMESRFPGRKFSFMDAGPDVTIGQNTAVEEPKPPVDWRTRYMTEEEYQNVQPPEFLIDGFLVKRSITMLAGPVSSRKTIIALNFAHACCTGEPLFGYFNVLEQPERVIYLCPEMGAASFVKRIKQIGLGEYVGKTLFVQTMSDKPSTLDDLGDELPGSVVLVDSITRFIDGDESKSTDMRRFSQKVFRLVSAGSTVILLHHSKKNSTGSLDDGLRGSSELAAFGDSCWVTELEDWKKAYTCLSKMRNVKQRDFECKPFKLKPAAGSYYLTMEGEPEDEVTFKSRVEIQAEALLASILKESPKMGIIKLIKRLKEAKCGKGAKWVTMTRNRILGTAGVTVTSE